MGRKARNRHSDAVMMFWLNLAPADKLECVLEMMRHIAIESGYKEPAPVQPKRSPRKGGGPEQALPLQSHAVNVSGQ